MNNEARTDWRWRITITHYATGESVEVDGGRIVDATQPEAIDKVDKRAYDIQTDWEALESNCHGTMLRKSEGRRTSDAMEGRMHPIRRHLPERIRRHYAERHYYEGGDGQRPGIRQAQSLDGRVRSL